MLCIPIHTARADECANRTCPPSSWEKSSCTAPTITRHGVAADSNPTFTTGEWELDQQSTLKLHNGVELRQGDRVIRAQEMIKAGNSDRWEIPGTVELDDPNLRVRGNGARVDPTVGTVNFDRTEFDLPNRFGHGSAQQIRLSRNGSVDLRDVHYTTCSGPRPDWELQVTHLSIDSQAQEGTARNTWVSIKGVPVFYTPYISFPIGDQPKSGLLFPSIGSSSNSGQQVSVPWYWRIAPNYDATFTPTWYSQRGVDMGAEFRFLTDTSHGEVQGHYLPNDSSYVRRDGGTDTDRSYFALFTQSDFTSRLRLQTTGSNVSDSEWLDDFGTGVQRSGVVVLPRLARLQYRSEDWRIVALAQNFQTICATDPDNSNGPCTPLIDQRPLTLLPQISFNGWFPRRMLALSYGVDGEFSNFQRSSNSNVVDGMRFDVAPEVSLPLRGNGAYLEPTIAWRYTAYRLNQPVAGSNDTTPSRGAPVFSVDTGLTFERTTGHGEHIQTLEPRLLYLYVPYRNQDALPIFDTHLPDFNLIQLFSTNRYVGPDRLGDANQIAAGVTSRLLESHNGQQFLSATVGEVYRFAVPQVRLPDEAPSAYNASDIIGELKLTAFEDWNSNVGLQWDPNERKLQRAEVYLQYLPGGGRLINAGYIYRRSGLSPQQPGLRQIDVSGTWPIGKRFNVYARYVYSLQDGKLIDGMGGLEYRDCCWGMRLFARRSVSLSGQLESSWQWQIELNGLSSVGNANDAFLAQAIRGYSAARFDRTSVP